MSHLVTHGYRGQIHRLLDTGYPACNTKLWRWGQLPTDQDGTVKVNPRRLCGNCFNLRDIEVVVRADTRVVNANNGS